MDIVGIPFLFPGIPGVRCLFQTPCLDDMIDGVYVSDLGNHISVDVKKNCSGRHRLITSTGIAKFTEFEQVHGDKVIANPEATYHNSKLDIAKIQQADGGCTHQKGLGLLIKTADCQPILVVHNSGQYIAAIHVGWRGNRIQFPTTAINIFCNEYNINASEVLVVRGPSLSPEYAVFTDFSKDWGNTFRPWFSHKKQTMDLWGLTREQLMAAGILPEHIYGIDLCTYTMSELFFSYRRDQNCGRQGSLIWIE